MLKENLILEIKDLINEDSMVSGFRKTAACGQKHTSSLPMQIKIMMSKHFDIQLPRVSPRLMLMGV